LKITILSFGITKDILGSRFSEWELERGSTVSNLQDRLRQQFPALHDLAAIRIAVNGEYAAADLQLADNDEVALIPPVSGG
jgi:molybdopterin synthase sulfur carrier subunit